MSSKACGSCGSVKSLDDFPNNPSSPDGKHSKCKSCRKVYASEYRKRPEVAERERERLKAEYLNNREAKLASRKTRYENNKEYTLEQNKKWRAAHLEQHREQCREWAKSNPEAMRAIVSRRRAKRLEVGGSYSKKDIQNMYAAQGGKCLGCKCDMSESGYHVDHVYPLSKGGSNNPDNLQLLCPTCNRSKADKLPEEWRDSLESR